MGSPGMGRTWWFQLDKLARIISLSGTGTWDCSLQLQHETIKYPKTKETKQTEVQYTKVNISTKTTHIPKQKSDLEANI